MYKNHKIALLIFSCAIFSVTGIYLGYTRIMSLQYQQTIKEEALQSASLIVNYNRDKEKHKQDIPRITSKTKIVYEQYDKYTGELTVLETIAPNFMLTKTREDIETSFSEWDVMLFTNEKVIMRRTKDTKPQVAYTLGIQGDFIAVFYGEKNGQNLKEITEISVSHLPQEERKLLTQGIPVYNYDELIRRLEDYNS